MNLVTRNAYAKLCGISRQAIHDRIKRGTLATIEKELPDGSIGEYIDIEVFPVKKRYSFRNKCGSKRNPGRNKTKKP